MPLARYSRGGKPRAMLAVKSRAQRNETQLARAVTDTSVAGEIEADFDAAGMKALRPVHFVARGEVMPLEAETEFAIVAVQLTPACAHAFPGFGFTKRPDVAVRTAFRQWRGFLQYGHGW